MDVPSIPQKGENSNMLFRGSESAGHHLSQSRSADDSFEFGGIHRIASKTRTLQPTGKAGGILYSDDACVTRAGRQQAGIVAKRLGVGSVGTEALYLFLRDAVDVFSRRPLSHRPLPVFPCLDPKHIETL